MSASLATPITPLLPTPSKTLDFASSTSHDRAILDFFTYNTASGRAGIVNLNTRNGPVLASIIRGAWLHDPGSEVPPPDSIVFSFPSTTPSPQGKPLFNDNQRAAWRRVEPSRCCPAGRRSRRSGPYFRSFGRNKADDRARAGRSRSNANLEPDDRRNRANGTICTRDARTLPMPTNSW